MKLPEMPKQFQSGNAIEVERAIIKRSELIAYGQAAYRAAIEDAANWQPIETAPRDATAILVMRDIWPGTDSGRADECNEHNTYVAQWWGGEGSNGAWVCYMATVLDPECPVEPTHWMPLPPPPSLTRP